MKALLELEELLPSLATNHTGSLAEHICLTHHSKEEPLHKNAHNKALTDGPMH